MLVPWYLVLCKTAVTGQYSAVFCFCRGWFNTRYSDWVSLALCSCLRALGPQLTTMGQQTALSACSGEAAGSALGASGLCTGTATPLTFTLPLLLPIVATGPSDTVAFPNKTQGILFPERGIYKALSPPPNVSGLYLFPVQPWASCELGRAGFAGNTPFLSY